MGVVGSQCDTVASARLRSGRPAAVGFLAVFVSLLFLQVVHGDNGGTAPLRDETRALLADVGRNSDPGRLSRAAQRAGASQLIAAVYRGTRAERYAALDALPFTDDPGGILPTLAALVAATDRGTAARAAGSLLSVVEAISAGETPFPEAIPGQISQLRAQLVPSVKDTRLDTDIRLVAATALVRLSTLSKKAAAADWVGSLLDDSESAIRLAALSFVTLPMADDLLLLVAQMAGKDSDTSVRGAAAGLLCENALAHKVQAPSADLTAILKTAVQDGAVPSDVTAGVLVCLSRFAPSAARSAVIEAAAEDERPEIVALLKSLKLR